MPSSGPVIEPSAILFAARIGDAGQFARPHGIHEGMAELDLIPDVKLIPMRTINFGEMKRAGGAGLQGGYEGIDIKFWHGASVPYFPVWCSRGRETKQC